MNKLTTAQVIALGNYLCYWDEQEKGHDFEAILNLIRNGDPDDDIGVAEAYEDMNTDNLADYISDLAESIQKAIHQELSTKKEVTL